MDPIAQEEFHRALLMTTARGHTQRAMVETRAREPHGDPEYADNLMAHWGYGSYNAQETQKLTHLARKTGAACGYLKELAALGRHGASPQSCSTDLMDLIRKVLGRAIIPIYVALVPMFVAKSESGKPEPELTTAGLLLPHVWVWFLYTYYRAEFFTRFLGCKTQEVLELFPHKRPSPTTLLQRCKLRRNNDPDWCTRGRRPLYKEGFARRFKFLRHDGRWRHRTAVLLHVWALQKMQD